MIEEIETSYTVIFTEETRSLLTSQGFDLSNFPSFSLSLPNGMHLAERDLLNHPTLGENTFEVQSRMYSWDAQGRLINLQYLLHALPAPLGWGPGQGAKVIPLRQAQS